MDASDTSPKLTSPLQCKQPATRKEEVLSKEHRQLIKEKPSSPELETEASDVDHCRDDDIMPARSESIIPDLALQMIPGLDMNSEVEAAGTSSTKERRKTRPSKIPLLFDGESSPEKMLKMLESPKAATPEHPKQPHTPTEEFTEDVDTSQFESYYHAEDDSPYNPEDQSPMDIDLSPIDLSATRRDVIREKVKLRLEDPFSGFENPTWEKIIKAKSKHEVVRHKKKKEEMKKMLHESTTKHARNGKEKQVFIPNIILLIFLSGFRRSSSPIIGQ